jgi:hypothetical protein
MSFSCSILAMSSLWCYLYGSTFTMVTNHQPFKILMELNQFTWKLTKWTAIVQEYDFDIVHKASRVTCNVDGLSWNPRSNKEDITKVHWPSDVDLEAISGWHASTYLCTLLGCFRVAPQIDISTKDSPSVGIKLKGVHDDACIITNLQVWSFN